LKALRKSKMPRPRRYRIVGLMPSVVFFKPAGIPMADLKYSILTVDEFEAVRLKDMLGMEQEECAKKMKISQPTFHRLVLSARKRLADAIVNGKAIKIEGGNFKMPGGDRTGPMGRGRGFGAGGRGRMGGQFAAGPEGMCRCPKCGYTNAHIRGQPCTHMICPRCGSQMTR
jgi:predicted DNA-binding protein (UPF0251 family)